VNTAVITPAILTLAAETVSETSGTYSTLTWLAAWQGFDEHVVYQLYFA
jgi:hypothetical protein